MRNIDHRPARLILKPERIAKQVFTFIRRRRPFNHVGVRRSLAHWEAKPDMAHRRLSRDGPTGNAAGFATNVFDAAQHVRKVGQIGKEVADRLQWRLDLNLAFK